MCGLAGYVNLDGCPLVPETATPLLAAMGSALHHRGPDDSRIMLWKNVGFVFKRLSIVDAAGGGQPFHTSDGAVSAMVNGAIYNHRAIRPNLAHRHSLRTQSDCEVIPYLYLERELALSTASTACSRSRCSIARGDACCWPAIDPERSRSSIVSPTGAVNSFVAADDRLSVAAPAQHASGKIRDLRKTRLRQQQRGLRRSRA